MPPYQSYLVFGYVFNSIGLNVVNASLTVITSVSRKYYTTNSDGTFLYDLAEAGYSSGETVTVEITETYNNEFKTHTFVVTGFFLNENITLELRTIAKGVSDISPLTILHSVGRKPITTDNPLPIQLTSNTEIDLVNNPSYAWNITRADGQPDSEDVTMNGVTYRRTFTYNSNNFLITRSSWVRQ